MSDDQRALVAHLMRRAGAGVTPAELDELAQRPYAELVEDLLNPTLVEDDDDLVFRYFPALANSDTPWPWSGRWIYWMVNSKSPLREKMALFWHHIFATAYTKMEHGPSMPVHIQMFREHGLDDMRVLLAKLSRDPAMIFWLDNVESVKGAPNENYGRELLELFSMGVGNYTEDDIKAAAYSFTGWTFEQPIPLYPHGGYPSRFVYREDQHDDSEKEFLGHTGPFNGDDIINIIVEQPATGRFIGRHLYNFFVKDEPGVSAWSVTEPGNPEAVAELASAFAESNGDLRAVMRVLFNAEWFKEARYERVKCPAEWVAGAYKLSGKLEMPQPEMWNLHMTMGAMGQSLMDPPSVEGWHTGKEWIDGGTLMERINFASKLVSDPSTPVVQSLADELEWVLDPDAESLASDAISDLGVSNGSGGPIGYLRDNFEDELVRHALDYAGIEESSISASTREALDEAAKLPVQESFDEDGLPSSREDIEDHVSRILRLVIASPEYQFA